MGEPTLENWWSEREVTAGGLVWEIGALRLHVQCLESEWQVAHQHSPSRADAATWSVEAVAEPIPELDQLARFALSTTEPLVRLTPRAADRSVVASPRAPLHVLAGEDARIYVSAPVWVEVAVGDPPRALSEMPSRRLTDTWFGSSTRDGEVAYALKTHARTRLSEVPQAASRAVTPVRIRNRGADPLTLDRMNLPVPHLSTFCDEKGALWTEAVELVRDEDSEMATFRVGEGPPEEARGGELLGQPRIVSRGHPLVRAFGRLLRPFEEEN